MYRHWLNEPSFKSLPHFFIMAICRFLNGRIWQGPSKSICVPGLNCYSCPGALGACPLGALQSSLSGVLLRFPFYVLGLMLLFGLLFGRTVCGWLCPFGFIQELLYKIPSPKFTKNKATRTLTKLKYIIGLLFVIILPVIFSMSLVLAHQPFVNIFVLPVLWKQHYRF